MSAKGKTMNRSSATRFCAHLWSEDCNVLDWTARADCILVAIALARHHTGAASYEKVSEVTVEVFKPT